jgi:hypothetical protein
MSEAIKEQHPTKALNYSMSLVLIEHLKFDVKVSTSFMSGWMEFFGWLGGGVSSIFSSFLHLLNIPSELHAGYGGGA